MRIPTLVLAGGLLAAAPVSATDPPTGEPPRDGGWVVELRGYTYHAGAAPKAPWVLDFLWPRPEAALNIDRIESHYSDDLRGVFERLKKPKP